MNRENPHWKQPKEEDLCEVDLIDSDSDDENWIPDNYASIEFLGEGAFGKVFKVIDKRTHRLIVMKRLEMDNGQLALFVYDQLKLMKPIDHPNVVGLDKMLVEGSLVSLVTEYLAMNLKRYIQSLPIIETMQVEIQQKYQYQLLHAIRYLHHRNLVHSNLKPQNLLIDKYGTLKVSDLGLSAQANRIITPEYTAPEILLGETNRTWAMDIWSAGCIFAELATKNVLFAGRSQIQVLDRIFFVLTTPTEKTWCGVSKLKLYQAAGANKYINHRLNGLLNDQATQQTVQMIQQMLVCNPNGRTAAEVLIQNASYSDVQRYADHDGQFDL